LSGSGFDDAEPSYAMSLADGSHRWYRDHAIWARKAYKLTETLLLVLAAAIPVSAAIWRNNAVAPAILGAVVVVMAGTRTIFHWQENYLRFSWAREAVEAERRLYLTASPPYEDPDTRDAELAARVTAIEHEEMAGWIKVASQRPNTSGKGPG
jgi:hypothetical protein